MKIRNIHTFSALSKSYDAFFERRSLRPWVSGFNSWLLDILGANDGALLDVACGEGWMLEAAEGRGLRTSGIDISAKALNRAAAHLKRTELKRGPAERLPWGNGSFDFVTCIGSLEHFLDPDKALREIARVLKKNGRALIYVPNSYYLNDILMKVLLEGKPPSHGQDLERFATRGQWQELIERNGLKVVRVRKYNPPVLVAPLRPQSIIAPFRSLLQRLIPANLSYCFAFVCEKE